MNPDWTRIQKNAATHDVLGDKYKKLNTDEKLHEGTRFLFLAVTVIPCLCKRMPLFSREKGPTPTYSGAVPPCLQIPYRENERQRDRQMGAERRENGVQRERQD